MKKEEFLELASQVFDQINPSESENKIALDKNLWEEIVDQISSEIVDQGKDLIDDYTLEMYSNEVTLESVEISMGDVERVVGDVLGRYFERK